MKTVLFVILLSVILPAQESAPVTTAIKPKTGQYAFLFSIDGLNVRPYYGIGAKYWYANNLAYFTAINISGTHSSRDESKTYDYSLGFTFGIEKYFTPESRLSPFLGLAISPSYDHRDRNDNRVRYKTQNLYVDLQAKLGGLYRVNHYLSIGIEYTPRVFIIYRELKLDDKENSQRTSIDRSFGVGTNYAGMFLEIYF